MKDTKEKTPLWSGANVGCRGDTLLATAVTNAVSV